MVSSPVSNLSSAVIGAALFILTTQRADASGNSGYGGGRSPGYGGGSASYSGQTCVNAYGGSCLGDRATCEAYELYKPGTYCPGKHFSYRREMTEVGDDEAGVGYGGGYAPQPGLDAFLCPCRDTLWSLFEDVAKGYGCDMGGYGGGYGGGGYGGGFVCKRCPGTTCGSGHSGGYRDLEESGIGYGSPSSGYGGGGPAYNHGPQKQQCSCEQIENVAIEKFCIAFIGDYRYNGGYGPGHGGYRELDGDEDEAQDESYNVPSPCSACVKDCIDYVQSCCSVSVCKGGSGRGSSAGHRGGY